MGRYAHRSGAPSAAMLLAAWIVGALVGDSLGELRPACYAIGATALAMGAAWPRTRSAGGVVLTADNGRIVCDNTLDRPVERASACLSAASILLCITLAFLSPLPPSLSRLDVSFDHLKPEIRSMLWPEDVKKKAGA